MTQGFFKLTAAITLEPHGEGWTLARHFHGLGHAAGVFGVVPPEEGDQLIIAQKFGTAIGMATFYPGRTPGTVWLALLWVDPLFRRQGVAGALIDAVMDWGRAQDLSTLELGVYTHNAPMLQLMRRLDMTPRATMFAGTIWPRLRAERDLMTHADSTHAAEFPGEPA